MTLEEGERAKPQRQRDRKSEKRDWGQRAEVLIADIRTVHVPHHVTSEDLRYLSYMHGYSAQVVPSSGTTWALLPTYMYI